MSIDSTTARPRSLSVVAALMILVGGMFVVVMGVALLDTMVERAEGFALRTVWMIAVVVLLLAAGIGLWKGAFWGWVCAILLVGYNFAWNIVPFIESISADESFEFTNSLIRIGAFAMLLAYLIRNPIMAYCGANRSQWVMALLVAFGSCVGFTLLLIAM